jgi:SAM-dependent methyltransferase
VTDAVVWHDIECGRYRADLDLWGELATAAGPAPIVEIGAGTGRVTLDLARRGHAMIALERDPALAAELRRRASGLAVEVLEADACDFALSAAVDLCIVPMQTVQLLEDRPAFLRCARRALRPGGRLALAILPAELHPFEIELEPDVLERDGARYLSAPTALRKTPTKVVLERRRVVTGARELSPALDVVELARLTPRGLAAEAAAEGFEWLATRHIPPTDEHAGSDIVLLSVSVP